MIKSESILKISVALVKAQSKMGNAVKDSNNPFYKSKYADLNSVREAVLPALHENEIMVLQPVVTKDGKNYVQTLLLHSSGEYIGGEVEIKVAKQNDPQAEGSGISYARRYGLQSLCCVGADDDDGNLASNVNNYQSKQPKQEFKKPEKVLTNISEPLPEWLVKAFRECKTIDDLNAKHESLVGNHKWDKVTKLDSYNDFYNAEAKRFI